MSQLIEFTTAPLPGVKLNSEIFRSNSNFVQSLGETISEFGRTTTNTLALPFDIAREQYAKAVQLGLIQSSVLAGRDFAVTLDAFEKATLGPWARRV